MEFALVVTDTDSVRGLVRNKSEDHVSVQFPSGNTMSVNKRFVVKLIKWDKRTKWQRELLVKLGVSQPGS